MSNSTSVCHLSADALYYAERIGFYAYRVLAVAYLFVGISTRLILLLAFYRQSKTQRAYAYQVVFTVSKILETFAFGSYLITGKWFYSSGMTWFVSDYYWVKFQAIGLGLHVSLIITSLSLSLAMAADRVFALTRPLQYKTIRHNLHITVASLASFALGFLGGSTYFVEMQVVQNGQRYWLKFDQVLEHAVPGQIMFYYRLCSRVGGVTLLIILNVVMLVALRRRTAKVATMTNGQGASKGAEKMLLWINIYQTCMMIINQMPHTTWQMLLFFMNPPFERCEGLFLGPISDGILMLTDTVDFFIVLAINRKMRKLVMQVLCCAKTQVAGATSVAPVSRRK